MKMAILAGGTGTRLWPRSRSALPKQFLDLAETNVSLLQETVRRILPLAPIEDILIVTSRDCVRQVAAHLPDLPRQNILGEPCGRGSAPAIGWAAATIRQRWGNETMASLHSDHHIADTALLRRALTSAEQMAGQGRIVTLGIVPTHPHTGLGHIRRGKILATVDGLPIYEIAAFVEKPDLKRAEVYTRSGEYYWNTGMFVWKVETILEQMSIHMPALHGNLIKLQAKLGTAQERRTLNRLWPRLAVEQIDYGVMEKTDRGAVVEVGNVGWSDLGDWNSLVEMHDADGQGNIVAANHTGIDTKNSVIVGDDHRLVGTIGLEDMVVVVTEDAVLVCPRSRAQDVRKLVDEIRKDKKEAYL